MQSRLDRPLLEAGFARLEHDIQFLWNTLSDVLANLPQPPTTPPHPENPVFWQESSIRFQLLNLVEENVASVFRSLRIDKHGPASERGLWAAALIAMRQAGASQEEVESILSQVSVEPVLTAHPTEAKRLSVLEQHRMLYGLIRKLNSASSETSLRRLRRDLSTALERLWRTGETHLQRPTVADERRNILYYLTEVYPAVLRTLDCRLVEALELAGYSAKNFLAGRVKPELRFGTWVGGDRDGHPLVTAEVTRETLAQLRIEALRVQRRSLQQLHSVLTLTQPLADAEPEIVAAFGPVPPDVEEPWRWIVRQILAKLPEEKILADGATARYQQAEELVRDLRILEQALRKVGAVRLAEGDVFPAIRIAETFGFHLANLDIRQNSRFHRLAMAQILEAAGLPGKDYLSWDEVRRREFLERELQTPRPFLPRGARPEGHEAQAVLDCYAVLYDHLHNFGHAGLGSLIVSMTTCVGDLLEVYLLAREAGLCRMRNGQLACAFQVVPLFETISDLEGATSILEEFLDHPTTRATLEWKREREGSPDLCQQVMVGYSDSCKDGSILASQWGLHTAQRHIAAFAKQRGIRICFFHGRGGTVSRGAGPTNRFLEALPTGSLTGAIRLTEQGETVAQKYANLETAAYNLELLLAGVAATTFRNRRMEQEHGTESCAVQVLTPYRQERRRAHELMEKMARASRRAYRALIEEEGFLQFYRQATPIDALEICRIGSRPARRTGAASLEDLRAIPWVFSWNQSRFYLPGWFGIGSALASLTEEEFAKLAELLRSWPFANYALTNIESSLTSSEPEIFRQYAGLVEDVALREKFLKIIEEEREKGIAWIERAYGSPLAERRPRMAKTLEMRAPTLRRLHEAQVELLRQWRRALRENPAEAERLQPALTLSVNAIASGLRTTG